jgi:ribosomal silencing factor RsfS
MGDSNSLWYYSDGDAIGTIDDADYFLAATADLTAGDIILVNSGGSNGVVDTLIVSAATSSTVTTVIQA